jgi:hypothetical protein
MQSSAGTRSVVTLAFGVEPRRELMAFRKTGHLHGRRMRPDGKVFKWEYNNKRFSFPNQPNVSVTPS